jgi:hypothetical protein
MSVQGEGPRSEENMYYECFVVQSCECPVGCGLLGTKQEISVHVEECLQKFAETESSPHAAENAPCPSSTSPDMKPGSTPAASTPMEKGTSPTGSMASGDEDVHDECDDGLFWSTGSAPSCVEVTCPVGCGFCGSPESVTAHVEHCLNSHPTNSWNGEHSQERKNTPAKVKPTKRQKSRTSRISTAVQRPTGCRSNDAADEIATETSHRDQCKDSLHQESSGQRGMPLCPPHGGPQSWSDRVRRPPAVVLCPVGCGGSSLWKR